MERKSGKNFAVKIISKKYDYYTCTHTCMRAHMHAHHAHMHTYMHKTHTLLECLVVHSCGTINIHT